MPAFQELQALIRLIINGIIWGGEGEERRADMLHSPLLF